MDMKLRHSQEAWRDDVKNETSGETKTVTSLDKPKPTIPTQPTQPAQTQPAVESPVTPTPKIAEAQGPQLTLAAVQDALKQQLEGTTWVYKDSQGVDHGPYPSNKMNEWIVHNYLQADLM